MRPWIFMVLLSGSLAAACSDSPESISNGGREAAGAANALPGEKKKCPLPDGYYFTYRFGDRPQLGTVILKIQVFGPDGKQAAPFSIHGSYGMPEMQGAHDSGDRDFELNRKGDYLLPMNIVMPGEWELNITFLKGEKRFYRGAFKFKV